MKLRLVACTVRLALLAGASLPVPLPAQSLPGLTINGTSFTYAAPDGVVTGSLRLPSGPGPFPALLLSHGKGGTAGNISAQHGSVFVTWGIACIAPDYTHAGSASNPPDNEGYCPENSRRARRALEILAATPGVDITRLGLFGHSMGSFMIGGLSGEIPAQIKAACISAGGTSGTTDAGLASPSLLEVAGITAPFLMFHGTADTTVPPAQSATLHSLLGAAGVPSQRLLYQDIGHDIFRLKQADIHALLRAWLTAHGVLAAPGNPAPTLAAPATATVVAGTTSTAVPITVDDGGSAAATAALTLQAFTTDDARLPNSALVLGGTGAHRTLTLHPPAGQSGPVEVWLVAHDGQLSAATAITVTLIAGDGGGTPTPNHRPEITRIADQRTTPGTAVAALAFTVTDVETAANELTVSATSSDETLLPASGLVLGGTGAHRTLALSPAAGRSGRTTLTLTVDDGTQTTATAFTLTVAATVAGNTPPLLQALSDETLAAGTTLGPLAFVVRDTESNETNLTLSVSSSDPVLVPASALVLGGTAWGRSLQVTPAAGQAGRATLTLTVSDGVLASSTAFVLDVVAGNTPPALAALPTVQALALGGAPAALTFRVADAETAAGDLRVTATSSNPALLPTPNLTLGGAGADRTLTLTPAAGQTGAATVRLTVSDGVHRRRAELLTVVHDPAAPGAQFSRPRGLYVLDGGVGTSYTTTFGATISLRDANLRDLPFVAGFTLRASWRDLESSTTPGATDFFIVQNALQKLPAGQRLSVIIVPTEPAYIALTPGVETWSDDGTLRATPWDPTLRARRRALLQALAAAPIGAGGIPLRDDPRLDVLQPYLPGGFTGIRDPNTTRLRDLPGYTRARFLAAVQDELRALQDAFPGRFVQLGFWPVTDYEDAYAGTSAADWLRQQLLAEFDGITRPRVGFFMENLAAKRPGPGLDPFTSTPVTTFASAQFAARDTTWTAFQMLGSWTRPFNDPHVTNTLYGSPADALEAAFNTYRTEYHEVYVTDIDHAPLQPAFQRWHDWFATALTTAASADEDGDGLPLAWEQQHGLRPTLPDAPGDDSLDRDGLPLLLEYAFGADPRAASPAPVLPGTMLDVSTGQTYVTCTFPRRTDDARLRYTIEVSADLVTWDSSAARTEIIAVEPQPDGVTERVTARVLPAFSGGQPRAFCRVVVTLP